MKTIAVINDVQIPYHDPLALETTLRLIETVKVDEIILNGDIADCYALSDFDKNPLTRHGLQREIDEVEKLLKRVTNIAPTTWLGGNHEDRLRRILWKNPEFADLHTLRFENLFNLTHYGVKWKPYGGSVNLGKLLVTHGFLIRSASGASAKATFERIGGSVLVGHTHRLGIYYRTNRKGVHAAYENGCLCRLTPEYVQDPDWQQGFSIVHVDKGGWFHVQQIPIIDRKLAYFGSVRVEGKG